MPELPDVTVYVEALEARILDQTLERIRIASRSFCVRWTRRLRMPPEKNNWVATAR